MQEHLEQSLRATSAPVTTGSSTIGAAKVTRSRGDVAEARMFGDVAPEVQLRMELVARASISPEAALPHVIALLVDGDEKRAAITAAINDNEPLREQWHRTWEVLRR